MILYSIILSLLALGLSYLTSFLNEYLFQNYIILPNALIYIVSCVFAISFISKFYSDKIYFNKDKHINKNKAFQYLLNQMFISVFVLYSTYMYIMIGLSFYSNEINPIFSTFTLFLIGLFNTLVLFTSFFLKYKSKFKASILTIVPLATLFISIVSPLIFSYENNSIITNLDYAAQPIPRHLFYKSIDTLFASNLLIFCYSFVLFATTYLFKKWSTQKLIITKKVKVISFMILLTPILVLIAGNIYVNIKLSTNIDDVKTYVYNKDLFLYEDNQAVNNIAVEGVIKKSKNSLFMFDIMSYLIVPYDRVNVEQKNGLSYFILIVNNKLITCIKGLLLCNTTPANSEDILIKIYTSKQSSKAKNSNVPSRKDFFIYISKENENQLLSNLKLLKIGQSKKDVISIMGAHDGEHFHTPKMHLDEKPTGSSIKYRVRNYKGFNTNSKWNINIYLSFNLENKLIDFCGIPSKNACLEMVKKSPKVK